MTWWLSIDAVAQRVLVLVLNAGIKVTWWLSIDAVCGTASLGSCLQRGYKRWLLRRLVRIVESMWSEEQLFGENCGVNMSEEQLCMLGESFGVNVIRGATIWGELWSQYDQMSNCVCLERVLESMWSEEQLCMLGVFRSQCNRGPTVYAWRELWSQYNSTKWR